MNAIISVFVISVEVIIYLLLYNLHDFTVNSENSVKLRGIEIDNLPSFDQHISTLLKKQAIN